MVNKDNLPQDVILVTTDLEKAQQRFLDTCSEYLSNWNEYSEDDKEELLDQGYEKIVGNGAVVLIDTDGPTSDAAIRGELTGEPAGNMLVSEVILDGEVGIMQGMTVDKILELCGKNLDAACAWDIQGNVLFKGSDGEWYTITTESIVGRANPEFVKDTLKGP